MNLPKWFDTDPRKKINERSKQMEEELAKKTSGKRQPGSGSSPFAPQDVKTDDYLIQHKYSDSTAFRIRALEWARIKEDALRFGRQPMMVIEFPNYKIKLIVTEWVDDDI